jgi:hypothetical protein
METIAVWELMVRRPDEQMDLSSCITLHGVRSRWASSDLQKKKERVQTKPVRPANDIAGHEKGVQLALPAGGTRPLERCTA